MRDRTDVTREIEAEAAATAAEAARPAIEALARLQLAVEGVVTRGAQVVDSVERLVKSRTVANKLFVSEIRECPACGHVHSMFNVREEWRG